MYLKSITLLTVALLVAIVHGKGLAFYDSNGGQYMAVMTSGDVGDFGYNYIINAGRVQMESLLNMSNTLFIPNVLDNYSAIAVAEDLVQKGYRVIVSGTFSHGNAMTVVASRYPNVTFVQYGSRSTLPNLSFVVWSNAEFWFAIGVFCGATAQNNKVGFIHPGPVEGSIQSINAFYSGVKYANQSLEVYTMYTGAFIAVDRAQGASDYLLNEIGVGSLSGQQDDLTIPLAAMKAGLLAVGVTGYSLRQLYGELVGVSFVRDWTSALANFSAGVSGRVYKGDISANFRSGGQYTDAKSHLVTQEQWDILQGALTQIKAGRTIFYCGPWMAEFGLNNATGCLNSTGIFNTKILSDVRDLGYYFVPTIDISFPVNTLIGLVVTTCLLLLLPLGLAISVIALRNTTEIKAGSPFFFLVMIVGCTIVYVGVLIWPLDPSEHRCYARIWLPSVGSTIAIGALITKNIRIFLLFFNPFKFRAENLAIKNFFPIVLVLLAFNFVILGIYTGAGPRGVTVLQGTQGLGKYETRHVCATSDVGNAIVYAILAYHMLQLIAGCVISFMLRNVTNKEFNERKSVAMAIYVITFCLVIVAVLVGVTNITNEQLIVFVSVALLICNTGALLIIFGSRFIKILVKDVDPIGFTSKMSKSPSGTANSGTGRTRSGSEDSTSSAAAPPSPAVPKAPPILTTAV